MPETSQTGEYQFIPSPVYAFRETLTQANCSCGWDQPNIAYVTVREARAAWAKHDHQNGITT